MTAIVFDLDGTLIDSAPDLHSAALKTLQAAGLPDIAFEQTQSFIGNGVPKLVERIMRAVGLEPNGDRHAEMTERFLGFYNAAPAELTRPYPNVPETLSQLAAEGHQLGICTNKPEGPARTILAALGLDRQLQVVIGGDTLTVKKPDPAPLAAAFAELGGTGLYVGDSEVDAATAVAADTPFLLFTEGYRKTPVAELPHRAAFDHFDRLPALVRAALEPA